MKTRFCKIFVVLAALLCAVQMDAEVILLKSGVKVSGTIVFRNDEVVVFKDASGSRYQYLMSDIESIQEDETEEVLMEEVEVVSYGRKKVAVSLQLAGGGAVVPRNMTGGSFSGDLVIGSANLLGKQILLGGAIGYHAQFLGGKTYSFLPLQLRAEVPMLQGKHMPLLGMGVGYGIALNKNVKGGLFAGLDFGWKYQFSRKNAIYLGVFSSFQGAKLQVTEIQDEKEYTSLQNRSLVDMGLKFGLYF